MTETSIIIVAKKIGKCVIVPRLLTKTKKKKILKNIRVRVNTSVLLRRLLYIKFSLRIL